MQQIAQATEVRSFELLLANKRVLELMANNNPLPEILNSVVELIENFASGCISTVYFVVEGKLKIGAAPSFPPDFIATVDGCPIGFNQGTCGHAAFTGQRAISTDVCTDEVWGPFRDWILSYGVRAAWSTPVVDGGKVLATVSMCWKEPRVPTEWDFQVVDVAVNLMKIAVNRIKQEELIEDQRLRLVNTSRLAAIGEMAANLAHEINNPLAVIQGHAQLLQMHAEKSDVPQAIVLSATAQIEKIVKRFSDIINGLKGISKDGEGDPYLAADMKLIIEETLGFCHGRFENSGVLLKFSPACAQVLVECRQVQVSQILLNLINNAYDAVVNLPEKWVHVELVIENGNCLIRVLDSGQGIPDELRAKIMKPFFTTKPHYLGTGLGLSISQRIIQLHNGELKIRPEFKNTCFEVTLPLKQSSFST